MQSGYDHKMKQVGKLSSNPTAFYRGLIEPLSERVKPESTYHCRNSHGRYTWPSFLLLRMTKHESMLLFSFRKEMESNRVKLEIL